MIQLIIFYVNVLDKEIFSSYSHCMINLKAALRADLEVGVVAAVVAKELVVPEDFTMVVERSEVPERGDYASPVALALTKSSGKSPMEIVEIVAKYMPKKEYVRSLEAAAPGFLNIWIDEHWLARRLDNVLTEELFLDVQVGRGMSANLEFISANPTGPLTLGNVRTAFAADTLANVLGKLGYNVTREYYINDGGMQTRRLGESVLRRILQQQGVTIDFAEELYQGEYIYSLANIIAEKWRENEGKVFGVADLEDEAVVKRFSEEAVELCLALIRGIIRDDLRITFDVWTSEKKIRDSGVIEKALKILEERGQSYEKEGAVWLKSAQFGDSEDRVLVKKDGEYAYLAPDIGYHEDKFERGFDIIMTFLGADHQGYIPRLKAAMAALGHDTDKLRFQVAQWLGLKKDGVAFKPSKRKGHVYGPGDLIAEIGYDAARFLLVQHSLSSHMELDLDLAKERSERNPVYYVQYAFVRLQSILRKAKETGELEGAVEPEVTADLVQQTAGLAGVLRLPAEIALIKEMFRLPEVMVDIAGTYEVHHLAFYAHELARLIHAFYTEVPVLTAKASEEREARLQVVAAAQKVLKEVLDMLGISKPDIM